MMNLGKWILAITFGLLAGMPGHALTSFEDVLAVEPQEQLQRDSSSLPFHYEQIHLLSLQQAVEQGHSGSGNLFPDQEWSLAPAQKSGIKGHLFLRDIRSLLEIHLFPFHSFW